MRRRERHGTGRAGRIAESHASQRSPCPTAASALTRRVSCWQAREMPVTRAALEETLLLQDREPRLHGRRVVNAERLLDRDPLLAVRGSEALEDSATKPAR